MEIARHWRLKPQRYRLEGEACPNCDAKIFPPTPYCPECEKPINNHPVFTDENRIISSATLLQPGVEIKIGL